MNNNLDIVFVSNTTPSNDDGTFYSLDRGWWHHTKADYRNVLSLHREWWDCDAVQVLHGFWVCLPLDVSSFRADVSLPLFCVGSNRTLQVTFPRLCQLASNWDCPMGDSVGRLEGRWEGETRAFFPFPLYLRCL